MKSIQNTVPNINNHFRLLGGYSFALAGKSKKKKKKKTDFVFFKKYKIMRMKVALAI